MSFSGNDLLNLLAIPFRRIQESAATVISIDREGNVTVKASEVTLDAENVTITGKLAVDGDISSAGNLASDGEIEASGKVKGSDFATPTLTFSKHMHPTAAQGAPSGPQPLAP